MRKSYIKSKISNLLTWEGGQRLFNFAYCIGAAVVIWGALFRILNLPGGNALLCVGMGTEVLMFVISAFESPSKDNEEISHTGNIETGNHVGNGNMYDSGSRAEIPAVAHYGNDVDVTELAAVTKEYMNQMSAIAVQMEQLRKTTESLNAVSAVLLDSYRAIAENSASISENSCGYVDKMNDLNRNLGGLNTIYEIQLKSVSSQLDSIERVNRGIKDIRDMYEKSAAQSARYCEETEKMARYMQQLNRMYEKTLDTMTINVGLQVTSDMQS